MRKAAVAMATMAAFLLTGMTTSGRAETELRMVSFSGATTNLPSWVAAEKGLFAKEGLKVTVELTRGSEPQTRDVLAGKYQILTTAFDNVVAYTEGQGAFKAENYDIVAIMGVHSGVNSVLARPEIKSYGDIKGKVVAVDALGSGYSTVLYRILQTKAGLVRDKDFSVLVAGGTEGRIKAMKEGKAAVAIISSPQDLLAKKEGFNILGEATQEVGAYQGSIYGVRRSWAKEHEKEVLAFIRAIVAATDWVFANKAGSVAVLKARVKGLSDDELNQLYDRSIGPGGLNRAAAVNMAGAETVLKLRAIYGGAKTADAAKYVDLSYYEKATAKK